MEQQTLPKNVQKYIVAYRLLLDALDEYRDSIVAERREDCRPEYRQEIRNRIARRCRREGREVYRRIPRQEERYRGTRSIRRLCWLGDTVTLAVGLYFVLDGLWNRSVLWILFGLIALTGNRIISKLSGLAQDHLVWTIMETDYTAKETVWDAEQAQLLPERLHPYVQPLSSRVDPQDCIRGKLKCLCGGEAFSVFRHPTEGYLRAVCPDCRREIVLFDEHLDARHADGNAQQYFPNALEMALCRRCQSELHHVVVTVLSDRQRSFFGTQGSEVNEDSEYCLLFRLF